MSGAGFGYVSQTPWLVRGTIRDNILFGKPYDEAKFKAVIDACALTGTSSGKITNVFFPPFICLYLSLYFSLSTYFFFILSVTVFTLKLSNSSALLCGVLRR